jgi:sugar lactone lactonase YvrE
MRTHDFVMPFALLLVTAGCGSYSTTPNPPPPPPAAPDGLWTASASPGALIRLASALLDRTGDLDPSTEVTTPSGGLGSVVGLAFGPDGTLWASASDDSQLLAFAPSALASSGSAPATTVIRPAAGSLAGPMGLAFDAAHHLWVVNYDLGTLVRFDPAQLAAGGTPSPAVVVSGIGHPTALAFDAHGSVWISDYLANRIVRYDSSQLRTSGSPDPAAVLTSNAGSLRDPTGLAFDAAGNLWVANLVGQTVLAFSPAALSTGGSLAPAIVLSSNAGSLSLSVGLAFGPDGSLWVVGSAGTLTKFDPASLRETGAPSPAARITVVGHSALWSAAFWPKPSAGPLQ